MNPPGNHKISRTMRRHLRWSPSVFREVACDVVKEFIETKQPCWSDELLWKRRFIVAPRLLAIAWRSLVRTSVVVMTGKSRKPTAPCFSGTVHQYVLHSEEIALAFLMENGCAIEQQNLFGESERSMT